VPESPTVRVVESTIAADADGWVIVLAPVAPDT
jgi:hypothetical protein